MEKRIMAHPSEVPAGKPKSYSEQQTNLKSAMANERYDLISVWEVLNGKYRGDCLETYYKINGAWIEERELGKTQKQTRAS